MTMCEAFNVDTLQLLIPLVFFWLGGLVGWLGCYLSIEINHKHK